ILSVGPLQILDRADGFDRADVAGQFIDLLARNTLRRRRTGNDQEERGKRSKQAQGGGESGHGHRSKWLRRRTRVPWTMRTGRRAGKGGVAACRRRAGHCAISVKSRLGAANPSPCRTRGTLL